MKLAPRGTRAGLWPRIVPLDDRGAAPLDDRGAETVRARPGRTAYASATASTVMGANGASSRRR